MRPARYLAMRPGQKPRFLRRAPQPEAKLGGAGCDACVARAHGYAPWACAQPGRRSAMPGSGALD